MVLFLWKNPNAVYLPNIQITQKKSIKKNKKQQQKLPPLKSIPLGQLRSYDMRFASSHHSRPRHLCSLPPNESGQLRYFGSLVSWKASNRSEQACCLRDSGRLPWLVHGVHELAMQGPISSRRNLQATHLETSSCMSAACRGTHTSRRAPVSLPYFTSPPFSRGRDSLS